MSRFTMSGDEFLRRLAQHLREAPQRIHAEMARLVERNVRRVLEAQFAAAQDPYRKPYLPPKDGHAPPMTRSGHLRDTINVVATSTSTGVELRLTGPKYATYLQYGTHKMAPRLIVPGRALLAPLWRDAIADAQREAIELWYRGTR